ncbi:MAG: putative toxin-antitoxin system toxin component, PIN family [Spirochaetaceae bacterium]|nr:MAG: putative toxin-antitoxin system toxin component, PIN family [Spirochaetaceae bacterium]
MRIVLDTNVLISGILNPREAPGSVLNAVLDGMVTVLVDDRILFECRDVLFRPKFGFPADYVRSVLDFLEHETDYVTARPARETIPDPGDLPFYEVAVSGAADYLVTGNARHFPEMKFVVSPGAFLGYLRTYRS